MRAITIDAYETRPQLREIPKPQPGEGELLIRLRAAGVNPMDWKARDGLFKQLWSADFPVVLGFDGAGVVEAVGPGVVAAAFRPGDAVCGQFVPQPKSPWHWGTFADYLVTSAAAAVIPKPSALDDTQAAALPMPAQTALACVDALSIGPSSTLLIVGATGGVGTYAVQLAALRGARVLATARPDAADYVSSLGAEEAPDYSQGEDALVAAVLALHPDGIDAVLDLATTVPERLELISRVLVRPEGRLLSTIESAEAPLLAARGVSASTLSWWPSAELLGRIARLVEAGQLKIAEVRTYPLEQATDALEQLEHGHVRGKVVLQVA
jgi:NADPH:quinone reductase-like Zn-dependent oxidoreductase